MAISSSPHGSVSGRRRLPVARSIRFMMIADCQSGAARTVFGCRPDTSWIVFTDQVLHAAIAGRHMLEQTFHLPVAAQRFPERSPLRVLERLAGRRLAQADGADLTSVA